MPHSEPATPEYTVPAVIVIGEAPDAVAEEVAVDAGVTVDAAVDVDEVVNAAEEVGETAEVAVPVAVEEDEPVLLDV